MAKRRSPHPRAGPRALAAVAGLLAGAALACGPVGPCSGGRLAGEPSRVPVADWSFTDAIDTIQLETAPDDPYSVNTWCWGDAAGLYVASSMIYGPENPAERRWVANVLADPRVRLRIDGVIYERAAVRVTDEAEAAAVRARLMEKYGVEPDDQARSAWIFRIEPR